MRRLAAVLVAAVALVAGAPPSSAEPAPVSYRPPVPGPVTDAFRPPSTGYGPGNLGVDYITAPNAPVVAAADGEVVFAGQVGGSLHVVVLHADGIRTSYSFLSGVDIQRGQRLAAGQPVGRSGGAVHFGARAGEAYLDPLILLGSGPPRVRLVPDGMRRPGSEDNERSAVRRLLDGLRTASSTAVDAASDAARWARAGAERVGSIAYNRFRSEIQQIRLIAHYAMALQLSLRVQLALAAAGAAYEWVGRRDEPCTPADVDPPPVAQRRLLVQVAGLGSHSAKGRARRDDDGGSVFAIDAEGMGYRGGDIFRFSYRGGSTEETAYAGGDTQVDIRDSGERLYLLLKRLQQEHPGVPIDIVAHSQGGLVVRAALAYEYNARAEDAPAIGTVVTLGTPHHGANLATAGAFLGMSRTGNALEAVGGAVAPGSIDPRSDSVRQLSETSDFIRKLNERPLPDRVRFVSVAARGDPIVPTPQSHVAGATNVIVDVPGIGPTDHSRLPASDAGQREVALAMAGLPPTCESLLDAVADSVVGEAISAVEDRAGAALGAAGLYLDRKVSVPPIPKRGEP